MASTERVKFQQDMQRVEKGYKMLADIESKLNGYFKASTGNNPSTASSTIQKQPAVKDFSEFNFKPQSRKPSNSDNRSFNVMESLIDKPSTTKNIKSSVKFDQTDRTSGLISNFELKEQTPVEELLVPEVEEISSKRQEMINNRISLLNSKIMKYQNENKELTEEFERGEALARLSHNADSIKQRALSSEAVRNQSSHLNIVDSNLNHCSNPLIKGNEAHWSNQNLQSQQRVAFNSANSTSGSVQFHGHSFNPNTADENGFFSNPVIADKINNQEEFTPLKDDQSSPFVQQSEAGLDREKQIMADLISKQKEIISKMQDTISLKETLQSPMIAGGCQTPTYKFRGSDVLNNYNRTLYPMYPEYGLGGRQNVYRTPIVNYDPSSPYGPTRNLSVPMSAMTTQSQFFNPNAPPANTQNIPQTHRGNLYSKVRNPLFSSYYQKKAEWNKIKSGHTLDDSQYGIVDLTNQVYGPNQYQAQKNYYPGPTFRGPETEEDATQTSRFQSRMNTAQFGSMEMPNTAPSLPNTSHKKLPRSSKSTMRSRSRKSKHSKTSRKSRLTKASRKSRSKKSSMNTGVYSKEEFIRFEDETKPVSRSSKRSHYTTIPEENVFTQMSQMKNSRLTKRSFKKKKTGNTKFKNMRTFNSTLDNKMQNLSNLGELVNGLTNLVESQIESRKVEPCQRLRASKKRNRAVETIVRSLSNNCTGRKLRRKRILGNNGGPRTLYKSTMRYTPKRRVLCKEKSEKLKSKIAKRSRKKHMKNILQTLGQFGELGFN